MDRLQKYYLEHKGEFPEMITIKGECPSNHIRLQQQIRKEIQADGRLKDQIDRANHTRPTITEEPIQSPRVVIGISLGFCLWGFAGASFFLKPLFGEPLAQSGQILIICTGCICVAIGALGRES